MKTKSVDNVLFEVVEENGVDFVEYKRHNNNDAYFPGMVFEKGDKKAGSIVLNQIAALIGIGKVEIK